MLPSEERLEVKLIGGSDDGGALGSVALKVPTVVPVPMSTSATPSKFG